MTSSNFTRYALHHVTLHHVTLDVKAQVILVIVSMTHISYKMVSSSDVKKLHMCVGFNLYLHKKFKESLSGPPHLLSA